MESIFKFILRHRRLVVAFFLILAAVCAFFSTKVRINSDLTDYLPKDSDSTVSLRVMEESFDGGIPNLQLMVKDISLTGAQKLADDLREIDGVESVSFADSSLLTSFLPLEMLPDSSLSSYYRDSCALFSLTVDENRDISTIDEIREKAAARQAKAPAKSTDSSSDEVPDASEAEKVFTSGSFASNKYAQATAPREIRTTVLIVIAFAMVLLLLSMDSYLEPFILLFCLLIGVLINMGSNLIFGTISSITNTAASVLQMGVSVDYSIFLLHRFRELRPGRSAEEAMVLAMKRSFSSVLSSSLTTIIGFLALLFMRYRIGTDMGLVLSKGIAISLICAFMLLPCMVLILEKPVLKTSHKPLISTANGLGTVSAKIRVPASILFLLLIVPALYASFHNSYYYGSSRMYKETNEVSREAQIISDVFGKDNTLVLLVPRGHQAEEYMLGRDLKDLPYVRSVTSYSEMLGFNVPDIMVPESSLALLRSDEYSRIVLNLALEDESEETFTAIEAIRSAAETRYGEDVHLIGGSVSTYDLKQVISADSIKVNLACAGAIFLVLILTFRSLIIPVVLTLSIEGAIWITMAIPYVRGSYLFYIGYLIVSSILLGATVDYAILLTNRYREIRKKGTAKKAAVREAVSVSAVSVLSSGLILSVAGLLLKLICANQIAAQLGANLCIGTIMAMIIVLFVLPGLLCLIDRQGSSTAAQTL